MDRLGTLLSSNLGALFVPGSAAWDSGVRHRPLCHRRDGRRFADFVSY